MDVPGEHHSHIYFILLEKGPMNFNFVMLFNVSVATVAV